MRKFVILCHLIFIASCNQKKTLPLASLHVVSQQNVRLLFKVVRPYMAAFYIVVVAAKESYMCGSCNATVNAPIQLPRAVTAAQISVMNLTWLSLFTNNKHSHRSSVK